MTASRVGAAVDALGKRLHARSSPVALRAPSDERRRLASYTTSGDANVPVVPGERPLLLIRAAADVLERAAFLEFCGGHDRAAADRMAVREYGLESWEALALALAPAAPGEEP